MNWEDAIALIGQGWTFSDGEVYKIIGVDPRPPKFRVEGVYLVLAQPGESIAYEKVG